MSETQKILEQFEELRSFRIRNIYSEVKRLTDKPIEFNYDPRGTQLYSIEELRRSFCRRFIDLADSASQLIEVDRIVSGAILARAQIETVGMATYFVSEVSRMIQTGELLAFEKRVSQFLGGGHKAEHIAKRVHVMDAMRHLDKLDRAYVEYLWAKYPSTKAFFNAIPEVQSSGNTIQEIVSQISAMKNYDFLSEFAHPNALGTFFIFGQPENSGHGEERTRELLKRMTEAATWQGHHMITALRASGGWSDEYFRQFGSGSSRTA